MVSYVALSLMPHHSGLDHLEEIVKILVIPSGDDTLDELLYGGFRGDFIYLLYGNRKIIISILMKTSVLIFKNINTKLSKVLGNYPKAKFVYKETMKPLMDERKKYYEVKGTKEYKFPPGYKIDFVQVTTGQWDILLNREEHVR